MNKQLSLLNGLAILCVVISHSAGYGQAALFHWSDQIRATADPSYTAVGSLAYYALLTIRQFVAFSVAAFVFTSGWFITYAAGAQATLSWKIVRARLITILIPYLIWTFLFFIIDYARGVRPGFLDYVLKILTGGGSYYFIPLICYLYLLSPFLVPWARKHGVALLIGAAVVQLATMSLLYLSLLPAKPPVIDALYNFIVNWSLPLWIFYYVFGLVAGFNVEACSKWIDRVKWLTLASIIPLGIGAVVESDLVFRATGRSWGYIPIYLPLSLLALAIIISFLAFRIQSRAVGQILRWLGARSLGLYLTNSRAIGFSSSIVQRYAPAIEGQQLLYVPLQLLVGLGGPLLLMTIVSKSPARKYYRYLFG